MNEWLGSGLGSVLGLGFRVGVRVEIGVGVKGQESRARVVRVSGLRLWLGVSGLGIGLTG